jgi:sugar phosphate isomerase/epimerase
MRLGGPIFPPTTDPAEWADRVRAHGYRAAYCPVDAAASSDVIRALAAASARADLVIAEVGAWSNPISPDESTRRAAVAHCQAQLALADQIGARCCVNIAGSRSAQWDGPHPDNLSEETFCLIVDAVREIIDGVRPTRTFYALETMPWVFPDSPASYLRLLRAIDRAQCAVHLDPVNLVSSPQRFYDTGALLRECFAVLGPYIKSCHAKDIALAGRLTVHLEEVRPGLGGLNYRVYLTELSQLDPDTPLMLEHLSAPEEYLLAAEHLQSVAAEEGVTFR